MQKIILLLIALTIAPWAKTWTQFLGGSSEELTGSSYLYFGERQLMDSLDTSYNTERMMNSDLTDIEYIFNAGFYEQACFMASNDGSCKFRVIAYNLGNDRDDSFWIQKKRNEFVFNDMLALQDTSIFTVPLMTEDYNLYFGNEGFVLDQYSLTDYKSVNTLLDSVYFVYKKDSSYYAYCLYVQSKYCWSFLFQCEFQDDGTTEFEPFETIEYPYPYYNPTGSKCLTKSEYEDYLSPIFTPAHRKEQTAKMNSVPYQVNGSRSRGGASSVIIRDGQPKLELRK